MNQLICRRFPLTLHNVLTLYNSGFVGICDLRDMQKFNLYLMCDPYLCNCGTVLQQHSRPLHEHF